MAGGNGQAVSVSSTDYVSARVTTSSIYADSALAALAPTVIAIDERIGLNLGEVSKKFRGNLDIPGADMVFTPHSSIVMPMELRLRFEARNASGNTVTLNVPVTKGAHGLDAITFAPGDVGRFLTSISGTLPDSLRVVGTVVLNPDYDTTAPAPVGRNCAFAGDVNLSILRLPPNGHFAVRRDGDTTGDGNADTLGSHRDSIRQLHRNETFLSMQGRSVAGWYSRKFWPSANGGTCIAAVPAKWGYDGVAVGTDTGSPGD